MGALVNGLHVQWRQPPAESATGPAAVCRAVGNAAAWSGRRCGRRAWARENRRIREEGAVPGPGRLGPVCRPVRVQYGPLAGIDQAATMTPDASRQGSRTPAAPPALLLSLGPLLLLAALLGGGAAPARGQAPTSDVFLHATWHAGFRPESFGPAVTLPGAPSYLVDNYLQNGNMYVQNTSLKEVEEVRFGGHFTRYWGFAPRTTIPAGVTPRWMGLALAGHDRPVGVLHSDQWAVLFTERDQRHFPVKPVSLLAGRAVAANRVDLLGLVEPPAGPREVHLWELTEASLLRVPFGVPVAGGESAHACPGPGRAFYLSVGQTLQHVSHAGVAGGPASVQAIPLPAGMGAIRQLAVTRLVADAGHCPGAGDVVLLLDSDQVHVIPCAGAAAPAAGLPFTASLPAAASAATGRLVVPPEAAALDQAYGFLYFLQPGPGPAGAPMQLWRAGVQAGGLAWRRLVLPPGHAAPGHLQLVRLRLNRAQDQVGEWALMADKDLLLESERFGCDTDGSIVCDGPAGVTGSARGWACAPGRVLSPFVAPGQLCADCAEEHYLDRPEAEPPFSAPGHTCRPCADSMCQVCDAHDCLVCKGALLLQPTGPGGGMACVGACSGGFTRQGGVCLPAATRLDVAHMAAAGGEVLPGPVSAAEVTGIGATRLGVDPATGLPVIPPVGTEPRNVLLFAGAGADPVVMRLEDIGRPGKPAPVPVRLFTATPGPQVLAMTELGPMLDSAGQLVMGIVVMQESGWVMVTWLSCQPPAPGEGCTVAGPGTPGFFTSHMLPLAQRLGERHFMLMDDYLMTSIIQADPDARTLDYNWHQASDVLPVPGEWVVQVLGKNHVGVGPLDLVARDDPRWWWTAGGEALLPAASWPDDQYRAVLLPRGPEGAPGPGPELVLVEDTAAHAWDVVRMPGSLAPVAGTRTHGGRTVRQRLGMLPDRPRLGAEDAPDARVFGVRLAGGSAEYPSALVLLSRKYVAVSVLWCRPGGRAAACVLLPAVRADLPVELRLPSTGPLWAEPVVHTPAGPSAHAPGLLVSVLTYAKTMGPVYVRLRATCPPGTVGLGCRACDAGCAECWAPADPAACTACPPGHFLAAEGGTCAGTCAAGTMPGSGPDAGACVPCPPGTAGPGCQPCHPTCMLCSAPGDPAACTGCPPGRLMTPGGACMELCTGGTMPGFGASEGSCVPCPASCLA
ncbi:hypothetical protein H696_06071 [Fonticula alba]|uniref:Uncharacterized protein n=1 Tax=Fonticula alba TaxID=691883 RepID=A0A058Z221_FONAL|nr:hypothetical protein H696_06071 [Fonticula alba]KCV67552.1 hypothetical protein H696_06071 [Fonticula alba]|eukprot:XP_009498113.1 hypothetical protein H696_06071 [Fonticula alba]